MNYVPQMELPRSEQVLAPVARQQRERLLGLDLARALAVSFVLICHACSVWPGYFHVTFPNFILAAGGFGVELFFVLSGFLIGGILAELTATRPTPREWAVFMVRRWMRTLPLYFAWMVVLLWLEPHDKVNLWNYVFLVQNFAWPMPDQNWFAVSWSLTIEEWFYLLFSSSLFLATAAIGARRAAWLIAATFLVVPFVLRYIEIDMVGFMETTYKTLIFHLDAISYGVIVALLYRRKSAIFDWPYLCLAVGVVIVVACWGHFSNRWLPIPIDDKTFLRWFSALTSLGYALCLPALLRLRSLPSVLSFPIRQLSTLSYGLYIIHLSVIHRFNWLIVGFGMDAVLGIVLATVTTFGLAALSWRYFESPILKARPAQFERARRSSRAGIQGESPVAAR